MHRVVDQLYLVDPWIAAQVDRLQASRKLDRDEQLIYHVVGQPCGLQIDMDQVPIPADELRDTIDNLSLLV